MGNIISRQLAIFILLFVILNIPITMAKDCEEAYLSNDYSSAFDICQQQADSDNGIANYYLSEMYIHGQGVEKNDEKALELMYLSAKQGHAESQVLLSSLYNVQRIKTIPNNLNIAFSAISPSVLQDLSADDNLSTNEERGVYWARKAAKQGHPKGQYMLGIHYAEGVGVEKDESEALKWYQLSAAQGDGSAQLLLGSAYKHGLGTETNITEALKWYKLASKHREGSAGVIAHLQIGHIYLFGSGVERNIEEALKSYAVLAEQGNGMGQTLLGFGHYHGMGVQQDKEEAFRLFNLSNRQAEIGWMYYHGEGVEKDKVKGLKLIRSALDKGVPEAGLMLGWLYYHDENLVENKTESLKLHLKATNYDWHIAHYELGKLYKEGIVVDADWVRSYAHFLRAKEINEDEYPLSSFMLLVPDSHENIEQELKFLEGKLSPKQLSEARQKVAEL